MGRLITIFNFICQEILSFLGAALHLNPQLQLMCIVRSPKSIAGAVGATLGNTPYFFCQPNRQDQRTAAQCLRHRTIDLAVPLNTLAGGRVQ
mgnify:CR=1 FL=1